MNQIPHHTEAGYSPVQIKLWTRRNKQDLNRALSRLLENENGEFNKGTVENKPSGTDEADKVKQGSSPIQSASL